MNERRNRQRRVQGKYWMVTVPARYWQPSEELPGEMQWIRGQKEIGAEGLEHYQVVCKFVSNKSLAAAKLSFAPQAHMELTRSDAANTYVHKDETSVEGTRFEMGTVCALCNKRNL